MPGKKLHICLIVNDFPGLTETFITTKALELRKKGHRITVIKNQDNKLLNASHIMLVKQAGIEILTAGQANSKSSLLKLALKYPLIASRSLSLSPKKFVKIFQQQLKSHLLSKYTFDVVHVEFSGLAIGYQKALEQTKAKTVVSCRGTAEKVKPLSDPKREEQLKKLFSAVNAVHCVSQDMADTIQQYCNNPEKIFINRPSIDTDVFRRYKPYPQNIGRINLLSVGRFTFQKGYLIGLMAAKELLKQKIYFKWTIVGDGPLKEEMIFHIHTLGLNDAVEIIGKKNRDEILELYNTTDIFMLTSVYEGIANVCLEAMSMELPVIATKSGGMEEVIAHGEDGLLCNIYDVNDIADAVAGIYSNTEKRRLMGIKARQKVMNEFTIQKQAAIFEEKYLQLTS